MQQTEVERNFKVLNVTSRAFGSGGQIPRKHTCEGDNVNPPLDIGPIPGEAKSLALIVEDPDAPLGTWVHWVVWNIPVTHHIHENEIPGDQGVNDFDRNTYGGPCPPSGTHRYQFKIYSLDDLLDLPEGSLKADVENAMRDHIVAFGELEGKYKKVGIK